jgi:hypothetical protein
MSQPLQSLMDAGTRVWLDSVDPDAVARNRAWGITGASSNPIIITDLIKAGRLDDPLARFVRDGRDDAATAWRLTDLLVRRAQEVFQPAWGAARRPGCVSVCTRGSGPSRPSRSRGQVPSLRGACPLDRDSVRRAAKVLGHVEPVLVE